MLPRTRPAAHRRTRPDARPHPDPTPEPEHDHRRIDQPHPRAATTTTRRCSVAPTWTISKRFSRSPIPIPTKSTHAVKDNADAIFTWDYSLQRPHLRKLYEKAKVGQWNATTDLDWSIDVDVENGRRPAIRWRSPPASTPNLYDDTVIGHWGEKEWLDYGIQNRKWTLSQFLHGEQGALLCTAKITETVPWYDAKLYASTQVVDEARHVEVFGRYLDEKMGGGYQVNAHLRMLLDDIITDSRWDMTYLGMQVMVEGLALAAFGFMHQMTEEPLLKKLLRYVMADEARHVAFGVLSLKEVYDGMTDAEMRDRQELAYEAAVRDARPVPVPGGVGAHGRGPGDVYRSCSRTQRATCSSRCCSPRSCRTARSWACWTATTSGCAGASRRWA